MASPSLGRLLRADSGKYTCVQNKGSNNSNRIIQYQFEPNSWFKWRFVKGDGWYELASLNALTRCIDVNGISTTPGAYCLLWDYVGGGNQKVRIVPQPAGKFKFYFAHDGLTWDVPDGQTANNIELEQYTNSGVSWQEFFLERVQ